MNSIQAYKVVFVDNLPQQVDLTDIKLYRHMSKITYRNNKPLVQWVVVYTDNPQQIKELAITLADIYMKAKTD